MGIFLFLFSIFSIFYSFLFLFIPFYILIDMKFFLLLLVTLLLNASIISANDDVYTITYKSRTTSGGKTKFTYQIVTQGAASNTRVRSVTFESDPEYDLTSSDSQISIGFQSNVGLYGVTLNTDQTQQKDVTYTFDLDGNIPLGTINVGVNLKSGYEIISLEGPLIYGKY